MLYILTVIVLYSSEPGVEGERSAHDSLAMCEARGRETVQYYRDCMPNTIIVTYRCDKATVS